ncbi:MAG: hypothetical protein JWO07_182, partial [Candidatus Saccharibacteria bacterium]|nr:hypothetical protein [Candidatus Saccharibacteria bacterium]
NLKIVNTDGGKSDDVTISSSDNDDLGDVSDVAVDESPEVADEPVENNDTVTVDNASDESDYAKKSRKELAELDDLDI